MSSAGLNTGTRLRRGEIAVDELRSPYIEAGDPDSKSAVVFTHGSPGCADEFARLVGETGEFTRAVAIDVPGFGHADKPTPKHFEYSAPNIGVHLAKQIDELGIERVQLVGHDFGGAFNLFAAAFEPTRVASIVMINSGMMRGYRWHSIARIYRTPVVGEIFMAIANKPGFKRTLSDQPDWLIDQMWESFDRPTRRAILALYRATDMHGQAAVLPQIRMLAADWPALVIFGRDDPYLPSELAVRNKESLPKAEVELMSGAGHWPHAEKPDEVAALLIPFLRANA